MYWQNELFSVGITFFFRISFRISSSNSVPYRPEYLTICGWLKTLHAFQIYIFTRASSSSIMLIISSDSFVTSSCESPTIFSLPVSFSFNYFVHIFIISVLFYLNLSAKTLSFFHTLFIYYSRMFDSWQNCLPHFFLVRVTIPLTVFLIFHFIL